MTKSESKEVIDKILSIVDELVGGMSSHKDKLAFLTTLGMFIDAKFAKIAKEAEDKGERGMHVAAGQERGGQMRIFHYTTEHFDISPEARNYFQRIMDNQAMADRHKSIVIAMAKDVDRMLGSVKQAKVSQSADKKDFTTATGHLMRAMYYSYVVVQTIEGPLGNINAWYPAFLAEDLYQVADLLHSGRKMQHGGSTGRSSKGMPIKEWKDFRKNLLHAVEQKADYEHSIMAPTGAEIKAAVRYVIDEKRVPRYSIQFLRKKGEEFLPFLHADVKTAALAKEQIEEFWFFTGDPNAMPKTEAPANSQDQDTGNNQHKYGVIYLTENGTVVTSVVDIRTDEIVWHDFYQGKPKAITSFDIDYLREHLIKTGVLPEDATLVNMLTKGFRLYDRGGKTVPDMVYENGDRTVQKLTAHQLGQVNTSLSNDEESSDKELADFWATEAGIAKKDGMHIIKKYRAKFRTNPLFELTQPGSPRPYEFSDGGAVKFGEKVKAIAKSLKGKTVPKKYHKKGDSKKYTPAMAREAAKRIAGAMDKD